MNLKRLFVREPCACTYARDLEARLIQQRNSGELAESQFVVRMREVEVTVLVCSTQGHPDRLSM